MDRCFIDCSDFQYDLERTFRAVFQHVNGLIVAGHVCYRMVILAGENASLVSVEDYLNQNLGMARVNGVIRVPMVQSNIVLLTVRRYNVNQDSHDVVVSFDLNSNELLKVEEKCGVGIDTIVEIRQYADISLWGRIWGVPNIGNPANSFHEIMPQPIVQHALDQISRAINLTNQTVFHPADDNLVKTIIMALHHHLGDVDSDEVYAYVIRNHHWPLGIANLLLRYFDTINDGRYFHGGDRRRSRWTELIARW